MDHVKLTDGMEDWIAPDHLVKDQDSATVRFEQSGKAPGQYRVLTPEEIQLLLTQGNRASDWTQVLVTDPFDPACISHNEFCGLVRLGRVQKGVLTHQAMTVPTGMTHSQIVSCDVGHDVAVHHVSYMAHTLVGDRVILWQCGEIRTTESAKFGCSQVKAGESTEVFGRIHVMNETGTRGIGIFEGMQPVDAMLWAKYRDDGDLLNCLEAMTCDVTDTRYGVYSEIQSQCVIKHARQLINIKLGPCTEVVNADRLEDVTISSTEEAPVFIGDSVTLCHGLVGDGCHITQGVRAESFLLGAQVTLEQGVRLRHSVVGDHSTLTRCEVLHSLIYPGHQQRHTSCLTSSCMMGQTHMAAGATLGASCSSQINDGEVRGGRGFMPGLCTSVIHPSSFASFVLLAQGDFPYALNITLPFSLVINDPSRNQLKVMPAYWWLHSLYAWARLAIEIGEYNTRHPAQRGIDYPALAPDTMGEIQQARTALEVWVAQAHLRTLGRVETNIETLRSKGRHLLAQATVSAPDIDVTAKGLEHAKRPTVVLDAFEGYHAYGDMILYYGVTQLIQYLQWHGGETLEGMVKTLGVTAPHDWTNLGGQLLPVEEVEQLREHICSGRFKTWSQVHDHYDILWKAYPLARQQHAYMILCDYLGLTTLDQTHWHFALDQSLAIQKALCDRVQQTRQTDYKSPFMQALFDSPEEMNAVLGAIENDPLIQNICDQTRVYATQVQRFKAQK